MVEDENIKDEESEEKVDVSEDTKEEIFNNSSVDDDVSDFNISSTILSTANVVVNRQSPRLEEIAEEHQDEKDWEKSDESTEEKDEKDFYNSSGSSYSLNEGEDSSRDRDGDLYTQKSSSIYTQKNEGVYTQKSEGAYSENKEQGKVYSPGKKHTKGYEEFTNTRRSGRSMLEVAGFEDKEKQRTREMRSFVQYDSKMD
jgi:hypothetical protein